MRLIHLFVVLVFILFSCQLSSRIIPVKKEEYVLTEKDVVEIAREIEKFSIQHSSFKRKQTFIYLKSATKVTGFELTPHEVTNLYQKNFSIDCIKPAKTNWECTKLLVYKIAPEPGKDISVEIVDEFNHSLEDFFEIIKVAYNERPMNWKDSVTLIETDFNNVFHVFFGQGCHKGIKINKTNIKGENLYEVDWGDAISCPKY
jgi:hypothetical protein